jgi:hypothetical protein
MEPKGILIYLNRGIAFALNNFGHKQYPSNSLDQNNSIHGVYKIPYEGIIFLFRFKLLIFGGKEIFFVLGSKL